ncbi:MAG TPA: AI-2E family transporter, partial [Candidatus Eisenbergiella stercorigallinarum]|nr:AI-2E family transporter [Candidatus Eisenbergiella stercorigallinarum]
SSQAKRILRAYLKEKTVREIGRVIRTADDTFSSFIIGQCTEAVILGTLCALGMLVFDFPYAVMIGSFIGVTALIPIVGAYLGAGLGAFMILTVDPLKALLFLIFIVVLQQLEGNLIYPRVVGSSIGLPGMWVLAAVTVGGGLMGIGGMLLGVPLTATAYKLLRSDVNDRNARKDGRPGPGSVDAAGNGKGR